MASFHDRNCAVCFEDIEKLDTDVMITKCNHIFHTSCFLPWIHNKGYSECPYCRTNIIEFSTRSVKNKTYFSNFNNSNLDVVVIEQFNSDRKNNYLKLIKKEINKMTYYISISADNKIYFATMTDDDEEIRDSLEEIGTYDWNENKINYKYDVKLYIKNNIKYLINNNNEIYDYHNHKYLGLFNKETNSIDDNLTSSEYSNSEDSEIWVLDEYFYFKGVAYRKDNGEKVDLYTAWKK